MLVNLLQEFLILILHLPFDHSSPKWCTSVQVQMKCSLVFVIFLTCFSVKIVLRSSQKL
uniref:Uncharacterized protein n=1 Tax=Rhizophora mucronata TaxID=61149 RepID=A0A2P2QVL2_RHIMU